MSERPARIVFLDRATFPEAVALRPFSFPHTLVVHAATAPVDVGARIADADIVITNKVPVRADAIAMAPRLAGRPDFILTPHVAWASLEAIQGLADQLVENIELHRRGTPRHVVSS